MNRQTAMETLCRAIWEMNKQAPHDFGGEQREFYLKRLMDAMLAASTLFPAQMAVVVVGIEEDEEAGLVSGKDGGK